MSMNDALDAIRDADVDRFAALVAAEPALLRAKDDRGRTLLHAAVSAATAGAAIPKRDGEPGHRAIVRALLDTAAAGGADPSAQDDGGCTPLHLAMFGGHVDLADALLVAGSDPTRCMWGLDGGTPLSLAVFYAKPDDVLERLDRAGRVPDNLRVAAGLGDLPRVRSFFVDAGATAALSAEAGRGRAWYRPLLAFPEWTPSDARQELLDEALAYAARNGRIEVMAELVSRGAGVNSNAYRGTPLLWATYADRAAAAGWLIDHGAEVNLRHDFGGATHGKQATALHLAAQYGCVQCIRLLLARGADRTIEDAAFHATPRGWAEHEGQPADVLALLDG